MHGLDLYYWQQTKYTHHCHIGMHQVMDRKVPFILHRTLMVITAVMLLAISGLPQLHTVAAVRHHQGPAMIWRESEAGSDTVAPVGSSMGIASRHLRRHVLMNKAELKQREKAFGKEYNEGGGMRETFECASYATLFPNVIVKGYREDTNSAVDAIWGEDPADLALYLCRCPQSGPDKPWDDWMATKGVCSGMSPDKLRLSGAKELVGSALSKCTIHCRKEGHDESSGMAQEVVRDMLWRCIIGRLFYTEAYKTAPAPNNQFMTGTELLKCIQGLPGSIFSTWGLTVAGKVLPAPPKPTGGSTSTSAKQSTKSTTSKSSTKTKEEKSTKSTTSKTSTKAKEKAEADRLSAESTLELAADLQAQISVTQTMVDQERKEADEMIKRLKTNGIISDQPQVLPTGTPKVTTDSGSTTSTTSEKPTDTTTTTDSSGSKPITRKHADHRQTKKMSFEDDEGYGQMPRQAKYEEEAVGEGMPQRARYEGDDEGEAVGEGMSQRARYEGDDEEEAVGEGMSQRARYEGDDEGEAVGEGMSQRARYEGDDDGEALVGGTVLQRYSYEDQEMEPASSPQQSRYDENYGFEEEGGNK